MTPPRRKKAKARTLKAGTPHDPLVLSAQGDEIVVWLKGKGTRPRKIGSVNRRLAADARRHGQDLVGTLVDAALRAADRSTT
ncbi:MAG: hypothetical protein HYZ40_07745 [Rhodospirillales bacterium]|nr:hypothetical protein [Rhodospirillales bacterium]